MMLPLTTISRQRESLKETLRLAPLGLDNLALSFDTVSGGAGIRLQLGPLVTDLPTVLCAFAVNAGAPEAACTLIKALLPPEVLAALGMLGLFGRHDAKPEASSVPRTGHATRTNRSTVIFFVRTASRRSFRSWRCCAYPSPLKHS